MCTPLISSRFDTKERARKLIKSAYDIFKEKYYVNKDFLVVNCADYERHVKIMSASETKEIISKNNITCGNCPFFKECDLVGRWDDGEPVTCH